MMKKNQNQNEQKIMVLYSLVQKGELSQSRFEEVINEAIDRELAKPDDKMDSALIVFCENLLASLHQAQLPASGKKKNWHAVKTHMKNRIRGEKIPAPWGVRLARITAAIMLVFIGAEAFFHRLELATSPSKNQQQYIVQVENYHPGTMPISSAAKKTSAPREYFSASTLEEFIDRLEYTPQLPQTLPPGWLADTYSFTWFDNGQEITVTYKKHETDLPLEYNYRLSYNLYDLQRAYDQTTHGQTKTLLNGQEVYFSTNHQDILAVWQEPYTLCHITGPITLREAEEMINSIPPVIR